MFQFLIGHLWTVVTCIGQWGCWSTHFSKHKDEMRFYSTDCIILPVSPQSCPPCTSSLQICHSCDYLWHSAQGHFSDQSSVPSPHSGQVRHVRTLMCLRIAFLSVTDKKSLGKSSSFLVSWNNSDMLYSVSESFPSRCKPQLPIALLAC